MARFPGQQARLLVVVITALPALWGQSPAFTPSAVVNAASYSQPLAVGGLATIFGRNLSPSTLQAPALPVPTELGGVRVLVNGAPSPVLYVSPSQVNFQIPFRTTTPEVTIQVVTAHGSSPAVQVPLSRAAPALFTRSGGRCGAAAAVNQRVDGSSSVLTERASALPGGYVSVFGTGFGDVFFPPALGEPAGPQLSIHYHQAVVVFGQGSKAVSLPATLYTGLAPGFVGLTQVVFSVPENAPEGCRVPLAIQQAFHDAPVTYISIRRGGGTCVDSPAVRLGEVRWTRQTTTGPDPGMAVSTGRISARFSHGHQNSLGHGEYGPSNWRTVAPDRDRPGCGDYAGANLDAGPLEFSYGARSGTLLPAPSAWGEYRYTAELDAGEMDRQSEFAVRSAAGPGAPALDSRMQRPSRIRVTTDLRPGTHIRFTEPLRVEWTGGTRDDIVHVRATPFSPMGGEDVLTWGMETFVAGDTGGVVLHPQPLLPDRPNSLPMSPGAGMTITLRVLPANPVTASAAGLELGLRHIFEEIWEFRGLLTQ
jgi:uncharacterized protein (TIGR03437 family)